MKSMTDNIDEIYSEYIDDKDFDELPEEPSEPPKLSRKEIDDQIRLYSRSCFDLGEAHCKIAEADGFENHKALIRCDCAVALAYREIYEKRRHLESI